MNIVAWYEIVFKDAIREVGFSDRALHLAAGVLIVVAAASSSRRPLSSPRLLLAALVVAAANETMDWLFFSSWRWSDTIGDMIDTLALPLLIYGVATLWSMAGDRAVAGLSGWRTSTTALNPR